MDAEALWNVGSRAIIATLPLATPVCEDTVACTEKMLTPVYTSQYWR